MGAVPFYEPDLQELVARGVKAGRLSFAGSSGLAGIVRRADVVFIAVGTPEGEDGSADLSGVADVPRDIGGALGLRPPNARPLVVVNKSTVPVGGAGCVSAWVEEGSGAASNESSAGSAVVSNPEFLREGSAVLINEVSTLCELTGADVSEVAKSVGLDGRIGSRFLSAGIGWGGSCFPKDLSALRAVAREHVRETPLLDATVGVNDAQRRRAIEKLQRHLGTLRTRHVALLGLSFKPNTDDLREAPSLKIATTLSSLGATVVGYDPASGKKAVGLLPDGAKVVFDPYEALRGAHAAVVATEWEDIKASIPKGRPP